MMEVMPGVVLDTDANVFYCDPLVALQRAGMEVTQETLLIAFTLQSDFAIEMAKEHNVQGYEIKLVQHDNIPSTIADNTDKGENTNEESNTSEEG